MFVRGLAWLARLCLAGTLLAAPTTAAPSVSTAPPDGSGTAFRLSDRFDEISGIAAGIRSPGVAYVENDGGDAARFFALDARSGAVLAVYTVPGARNVDWEDIAVAPDAQGTPSVWLADIGDNDAQRKQIQIYRVDEPRVDRSRKGASLRTSAPQVWRLTYPDGPQDAESLAVSPDGVPYIVTKSLLGVSGVYVADSSPGRSTLRRVGSIRFVPTGTPGPFAPLGQLTATGADISPGGDALVVRTYTDAYVWRIRGGDLASALRSRPTRIALPYQPQGEGVCFAGNHLLIDSEHVGSAVYSIPLPPEFVPRPTPTTSASTTRAASSSASVAESVPHGPTSAPAGSADHGGPSGWGWALAAAAVTALIAAAVGLRRRRR